MPTDRPVHVRIGRVTFRFPDEEMFRRWADAPDTPPEAYAARPIRVDLSDRPPVRPPSLGARVAAWWGWVRRLRLRHPRRLLRLVVLTAPFLMIWAFAHARPGLGLVAFLATALAIVEGVE